MIETSVLPCGIRLVTETMADVHSVAVAYWVGTGSRDEPGELAGAALLLTDPQSAYLTGTVLPVDGGWTCH